MRRDSVMERCAQKNVLATSSEPDAPNAALRPPASRYTAVGGISGRMCQSDEQAVGPEDLSLSFS